MLSSGSKSELQKTIQDQKDKITRLEKNFREVTNAYKNLLAEKETLETSLKSLKTDSNDASEFAALKSNFQALLDTKAKLEANFQHERKRLKAECEELKAIIKQNQAEKEKLVQENSLLTKELRRKLTDEKSQQAIDNVNQLETSNKEYKDLSELLRRENDELKNLVKELNDKKTNDEVLMVQNELNQIKIEYKNRMLEDKLKIEISEKLLKENIEKNEKRVAKLESELTELYQIIAIYENKKTSEKKYNYDSYLNQSFNITNDYQFELNGQQTEVDKAIQKMYELKEFVEKNSKDFDFYDIISPLKSESKHNLHEKCQEEYRLLKEEFEKYKIKMNQTLKTPKFTKITTNDNIHVQKLKDEIELLKEKLLGIEKSKITSTLDYEMQIKDYEKTINQMKEDQKNEINRLEQRFKQTIDDLTNELIKQRERTLKLITDKDAEIERLNRSSEFNKTSDIQIQQQDLSKLNLNTNEATLLHYSQEIAFKDAEIVKLRNRKKELEIQIKDLIAENNIDIENYRKQNDLLKNEIERLKLNFKRDQESSSNMEYIKNVLYRFLTTKDHNVKLSMINAIMQILQFSKQEKNKVLSVNI